MGPESCLDMSQRHTGLTRGKRAAQRAGRIALDDQQIGWVDWQQPPQGRADQLGMKHRVGLARTIQRRRIEAAQPMIAQFQLSVLPRDEQMRCLTEIG